jgi:hypothetical protein
MIISDLEHLETLAETRKLQGGVSENVISLSLSKGILSLKLNDQDLFTTPYTQIPSSFVFSLEGVSKLRSSYKLENINGVVKSSWTLSSGTSSNDDVSSLFSFYPKAF